MNVGQIKAIVVLALVFGCGGETEPSASIEAPEPSVAPNPESETPSAGEPEAEVAPEAEPESEPLNLLAAVTTQLATSSVYRGHPTQVARMLDGDTETAWNSRTGDLVGAWIEVRVPDDANVTGAAMIVGFTHENDGRDLFVENPRVTKVSVSRDGQSLGEFDLDPEVRSLQAMAFEGTGGVYRIEVLEVLAGANPNWRETCIAEFQLLGHAPAAGEGRIPTTAVGELPALPAPVDRDAVARAHRQRVHAFARTWVELESIAGGADMSGEADEFDQEELTRLRRRALTALADYASPVDGTAGDPVRSALASRVDWSDFTSRRDTRIGDLALATAALDAVAEFVGDDAARCRTARALGGLHLRRVSDELLRLSQVAHNDGVEPGDSFEIATLIDEANEAWSSNTRGMATRLARLEPTVAARGDFDALQAQVVVAQSTCGWE